MQGESVEFSPLLLLFVLPRGEGVRESGQQRLDCDVPQDLGLRSHQEHRCLFGKRHQLVQLSEDVAALEGIWKER